jgi:hypothetical protein
MQARFVAPDGRVRLPGAQDSAAEPDVEGIWVPDRLRVFIGHIRAVRGEVADSLGSSKGTAAPASSRTRRSRHRRIGRRLSKEHSRPVTPWLRT